MKTKRLLSVAALILAGVVPILVGSALPAAAAHGVSRSDGNDAKGPLDLAGIRLTPIRSGDRLQVKTLSRFTAAQLDGDQGWIEVDFDTDGDRKIDYWVVTLYHKGKIVSVEGRGSSAIRYLPARRVDARTVSFDIQHKFLGKVKSYDFLGVSVWRAAPCSKTKPCVDTIPNRYPLLRYDFTPPTVYLGKVPAVSTLVSNTLTFPVSFKVKDDHVGSGLRSWTLQERPYGDTTWTNVKKGTSMAPVVQVTAVEGAILDFRVVAVDRQGNRDVQGIGRAAVPMDDRNAAIGYSVPPTQTARPNAFLGTISGIANGETVTFSVNLTGAGSTDVCLIGGPPATAATTAGATYAVDGGPTGGALTELASTPDLQAMLCLGMSSGAHTLVITGTTAEPFVVDGFYTAP